MGYFTTTETPAFTSGQIAAMTTPQFNALFFH
jgi:hypothetical protein